MAEQWSALALAAAKAVAKAAGKPATREPGLKAIHAVLNRQHFATDREACDEYGVQLQRFYEWKSLCPKSAAPVADELQYEMRLSAASYMEEECLMPRCPRSRRLYVSSDWVSKNTPNLTILDFEADQWYGTTSNGFRGRPAEGEHREDQFYDEELGRYVDRFNVSIYEPEMEEDRRWYRRSVLVRLYHPDVIHCPDLVYECAKPGESEAEAGLRHDRNRRYEERLWRRIDEMVAGRLPRGVAMPSKAAEHRDKRRRHAAAVRAADAEIAEWFQESIVRPLQEEQLRERPHELAMQMGGGGECWSSEEEDESEGGDESGWDPEDGSDEEEIHDEDMLDCSECGVRKREGLMCYGTGEGTGLCRTCVGY